MRVRNAFLDLDVGGRVDLHLGAGDRTARGERRHPHAHLVRTALAHAQPQIAHAHHAVEIGIPDCRLLVVIPPGHPVTPLIVLHPDGRKIDAVLRLAVLERETERNLTLLVRLPETRQRERLHVARQLAGILLVRTSRLRRPIVVAVLGIHILLAREHLHHVARLHAPQLRIDVRHVHRLDADRAASGRRQIAALRRVPHAGLEILALEFIGEVLRKRPLGIRVRALAVEREALAHLQDHLRPERVVAGHNQVRIEIPLAAPPFIPCAVAEARQPLMHGRYIHVVAHNIHVRTLRERDVERHVVIILHLQHLHHLRLGGDGILTVLLLGRNLVLLLGFLSGHIQPPLSERFILNLHVLRQLQHIIGLDRLAVLQSVALPDQRGRHAEPDRDRHEIVTLLHDVVEIIPFPLVHLASLKTRIGLGQSFQCRRWRHYRHLVLLLLPTAILSSFLLSFLLFFSHKSFIFLATDFTDFH